MTYHSSMFRSCCGSAVRWSRVSRRAPWPGRWRWARGMSSPPTPAASPRHWWTPAPCEPPPSAPSAASAGQRSTSSHPCSWSVERKHDIPEGKQTFEMREKKHWWHPYCHKIWPANKSKALRWWHPCHKMLQRKVRASDGDKTWHAWTQLP